MATVTLKGTPFKLSGELPAVGSSAPDFRLVGADMQDVSLATYKGKTKILSIVPSLDTPVCQAQTRAFNVKAAQVPNAVILTVSADLPFAQKRFCAAEGLTHVSTLSMMRGKNFAKDYGVMITEGPLEGITARAVVVVDENDKVVYTQLVPEISQEPDYDPVLAAVK